MGPRQSKNVDTDKKAMDMDCQMSNNICEKLRESNLELKSNLESKDALLASLVHLSAMQDPAREVSLGLTEVVNSLPKEHREQVSQIVEDFTKLLLSTIKFCGDIEAHHTQRKSAITKLKLIFEMPSSKNTILISQARSDMKEAQQKSTILMEKTDVLIKGYEEIKQQLHQKAKELQKLSRNKVFWRRLGIGLAVLGTMIIVGAGVAALTVVSFGATAPLMGIGGSLLLCGGFAGVASLGAGALMSCSAVLEETTSVATHMKEKMEALADGCGKSITALHLLDRVLIRDNTHGKDMCGATDVADEQLVHLFSQQDKYDELKAMETNLHEVLVKARELSDQTASNYAELMRRK